MNWATWAEARIMNRVVWAGARIMNLGASSSQGPPGLQQSSTFVVFLCNSQMLGLTVAQEAEQVNQ